MASVWVILMLAGQVTPPAGPAAPAPVPTAPAPKLKVALLPAVVKQDVPALRDVAPMLSATLAARLEERGGFSIITAEEVRELVAAETTRQAVGCTDDGCLAELVGALGAQRTVSTELSMAGATYLWVTSLQDAGNGKVLKRVAVEAASTDALLAQAPEVVAELTGDTSGVDERRRLGFLEKAGLEKFRRERAATPGLTTSEALTAFLLRHNLESRWLAVAQALAFGGAAVAVGLLALVSYGYVLAVIYPNAYLLLAGTMTAWILIPAALLLGGTGLVLAAVDALNLGRVEVAQRGCCRDDAAIADAEQETSWEQVAGLVVLLSGPVAITGVVLASVASGLTVAFITVASRWAPVLKGDPNWLYPIPVALGAGLGYLTAFWCGLPLVVLPLCCGTPVGALLLWWPRKNVVGDVVDVPPDEAPKARPRRRLKKRPAAGGGA